MAETTTKFEVRFNGISQFVSSSTVAGLLQEFGLTNQRVAVELNKEIVPRSDYDAITIKSGDDIEIVSFIGGG